MIAYPTLMRCPCCGSEEIARDAAATWDVTAQEWRLADVHDTMTCQVCGRDFSEAEEAEGKALTDKPYTVLLQRPDWMHDDATGGTVQLHLIGADADQIAKAAPKIAAHYDEGPEDIYYTVLAIYDGHIQDLHRP